MGTVARALAVCLALCLATGAVSAHQTIDLSGNDWAISNGNGSIRFTSTVPAYPLGLLIANGSIEDPLYGWVNGTLWIQWALLRSVLAVHAPSAAHLACWWCAVRPVSNRPGSTAPQGQLGPPALCLSQSCRSVSALWVEIPGQWAPHR